MYKRQVLRLGATGTGLDVDEAVGRIQFAGEHALEFQLLDVGVETFHVGDDGQCGVFVVFALGQFQQFTGLAQSILQGGNAVDVLLKAGTLAAQGLGVFGVAPDIRVFQFPVYFFQALALGFVVKDTPEARPADPGGRRCAGGLD